MSELDLIIASKDDLRSVIYQWLDEHPHFLCNTDSKTSELEKPMNRKELAEYLGISKATVTDWMKKGLPYKRMHGRVFFMIDDVMASMSSFNHRNNSFLTL